MPADIREYLMERFHSDAVTLRERVRMLEASPVRAGSKPVAGPDIALSAAMADACDHVVDLSTQLPEGASLEDIVAALRALLPELTARGPGAPASVPPAVRSVYAGAATRVGELIAAETHQANEAGGEEQRDDIDDIEDEDEDEDEDEEYDEDDDNDDNDDNDDDDDEDDAEADEGRK